MNLIRRGSKHPHEKPFYALRDMNFSVEAGESVVVIGRNGSGKTLAAGYDPYHATDVWKSAH